MIRKDKELLLCDLCARLPYDVKISVQFDDKQLVGILDAVYPKDDRVIVDDLNEAIAPINVRFGGFLIEENNIKPYLRPMSSMTEEEMEEFESLGWRIDELADNEPWAHCGDIYHITDGIDWLSKNHFDFRGLIEKGLAIAVTKENNPYKTERA